MRHVDHRMNALPTSRPTNQIMDTASYRICFVAPKNSRKSVRWTVVPVPCLSRLCLKLRGEQGSGPKEVDDLCFHTYGEFSPPPPPPPPPPHPPPPSLEAHISASRPISQPRGPYLSLEAHISASRPISQPQGPNPSLEAQIP